MTIESCSSGRAGAARWRGEDQLQGDGLGDASATTVRPRAAPASPVLIHGQVAARVVAALPLNPSRGSTNSNTRARVAQKASNGTPEPDGDVHRRTDQDEAPGEPRCAEATDECRVHHEVEGGHEADPSLVAPVRQPARVEDGPGDDDEPFDRIPFGIGIRARYRLGPVEGARRQVAATAVAPPTPPPSPRRRSGSGDRPTDHPAGRDLARSRRIW